MYTVGILKGNEATLRAKGYLHFLWVEKWIKANEMPSHLNPTLTLHLVNLPYRSQHLSTIVPLSV